MSRSQAIVDDPSWFTEERCGKFSLSQPDNGYLRELNLVENGLKALDEQVHFSTA